MDFMTLLDLKNRLEPGDASIAGIAEVLWNEDEMLEDIPWERGNLLTGDVNFTRVERAKGQKRKINQGVKSSTSKTEPNTDTCVEFASRSVVDERKLKNYTNGSTERSKYLLSESSDHIKVLSEMLFEELVYGDDAEGIRGFMSRYNSKSSGPRKDQVFDIGGTTADGDLTSILVVHWDPNEVAGIYPKYSKAGLDMTSDRALVPDRNNDPLWSIVSDFYWLAGLKIRDHRYVARIANIPTKNMFEDEALLKKILNFMIIAKNKVHKPYNGRTVFYVNPDLYTAIELAAINKTNMALGYRDIEGKTSLVTYAGIRIRKNESMTRPEKQVV